MESIGEISIAPPRGRDFGNSRRARADEAQPQEAQHSGPQGEPGPTAPARSAPLFQGRAGVFEGWGFGAPLVLFLAARRGKEQACDDGRLDRPFEPPNPSSNLAAIPPPAASSRSILYRHHVAQLDEDHLFTALLPDKVEIDINVVGKGRTA